MSDTSRNPVGSMQEQFSKLLESFQVPGVDLRSVLDSQRKNVEALTQATQIATEGATAVGRRQAEILRSAIEQAATMARNLKVTGNPSEAAAAQSELFRKAVEIALANARELAEMVEKSNREAFEVIQRRVSEGLQEIRNAVPGGKAGSTS
jgi:phasin family protein